MLKLIDQVVAREGEYIDKIYGKGKILVQAAVK